MSTRKEHEFRNHALSFFGLSPEKYSKENVRIAYYRLAKKYHPDSGGTKADFHTLTEIYKWLQKDLEKSRYETPLSSAEMTDQIRRRQEKIAHVDDEELKEAALRKFKSGKNFNAKEFNRIFEEIHVREEEEDWLKKEEDPDLRPSGPVRTREEFNAQFQGIIKKNAYRADALMVPGSIGLVSKGEIFEKGGRHSTDMAGRVIGIGSKDLAFSDVRDAYTEASMISTGAASEREVEHRTLESFKRQYAEATTLDPEAVRKYQSHDDRARLEEERRYNLWLKQNREAEERMRLFQMRLTNGRSAPK